MTSDWDERLKHRADLALDENQYLGAKQMYYLALLAVPPDTTDLARLESAEEGEAILFRQTLKAAHKDTLAAQLAEPDYLLRLNPRRAIALYTEILVRFTDSASVLLVRERRFDALCRLNRFDEIYCNFLVDDFWYVWTTRAIFEKVVGQKGMLMALLGRVRNQSFLPVLDSLEKDTRTTAHVIALAKLKRAEISIWDEQS